MSTIRIQLVDGTYLEAANPDDAALLWAAHEYGLGWKRMRESDQDRCAQPYRQRLIQVLHKETS